MKHNKGIFILLLVSILMAVALVGVTATYFTVSKGAVGKISVKDVEVTLNESHEQDSIIVPGQILDELISVTNNNEPAWVRVRLVVNWVAPDGRSGELTDPTLIALDFAPASTSNPWFYDGGSGYWYYNRVLDTGESTESLTRNFYLKGRETGNKYSGFKVSIKVSADSIQADHVTLAEWMAMS